MKILFICFAVITGVSICAADQIIALGDLPGGPFESRGQGLSADGTTAVGRSVGENGTEAFRWTQQTGMVGLGDLPGNSFYSEARSVSQNGSIIVGFSHSFNGYEAFTWSQATGMVGLGDFTSGEFGSVAYGISRNGQWIVGSGTRINGEHAFRMGNGGVFEPLGTPAEWFVFAGPCRQRFGKRSGWHFSH